MGQNLCVYSYNPLLPINESYASNPSWESFAESINLGTPIFYIWLLFEIIILGLFWFLTSKIKNDCTSVFFKYCIIPVTGSTIIKCLGILASLIVPSIYEQYWSYAYMISVLLITNTRLFFSGGLIIYSYICMKIVSQQVTPGLQHRRLRLLFLLVVITGIAESSSHYDAVTLQYKVRYVLTAAITILNIVCAVAVIISAFYFPPPSVGSTDPIVKYAKIRMLSILPLYPLALIAILTDFYSIVADNFLVTIIENFLYSVYMPPAIILMIPAYRNELFGFMRSKEVVSQPMTVPTASSRPRTPIIPNAPSPPIASTSSVNPEMAASLYYPSNSNREDLAPPPYPTNDSVSYSVQGRSANGSFVKLPIDQKYPIPAEEDERNQLEHNMFNTNTSHIRCQRQSLDENPAQQSPFYIRDK